MVPSPTSAERGRSAELIWLQRGAHQWNVVTTTLAAFSAAKIDIFQLRSTLYTHKPSDSGIGQLNARPLLHAFDEDQPTRISSTATDCCAPASGNAN